ncbi:S-adenosylmethionine:tRNA ribosyltransferase-isomerase [Paraliomyxa miuraensis]|uniref:S-adenosylmethionine:tRNA ribosyltransferase-isomerase n=1 Tax=Paraliomyxa miuraensis TaxID=376150 RepID=UPI00224F9C99|nr:S-adenosylmethionine:tRNA ribosyltransferase-isomerase [Paraliomyxa miuraensis]MCX4241448.1 S-adenosylmethionine:tRNA ribosyltransferase-isomerase [Paraliomyxa miuraensis]
MNGHQAWKAAAAPRGVEQQRLLVVDPRGGVAFDTRARALPELLRAGDLVVVNDAATLPASLPVRTESGRAHELRVATADGPTGWWVVLMGEGDWRTPTERRPLPEPLDVGDAIALPDGTRARVVERSPRSPRLLRIDWGRDDASVLALLYRHGAPIQYSYLRRDLRIEEVQTPFGVRPWAVEMPSASRPLDWAALAALRRHGVQLATLTHAAGLSSTGDDALDAQLPLPERYEIPARTVDAIARAHARGGRVLAVGTTVVRALEGNAITHGGRLRGGTGITALRIDPGFRPEVVDGLLSGVHEPGTSHYDVVSAFAPAALVDAAHEHAADRGLLVHEFGDATLVLPGVAEPAAAAA